jgi:FkbM family methyltransferase
MASERAKGSLPQRILRAVLRRSRDRGRIDPPARPASPKRNDLSRTTFIDSPSPIEAELQEFFGDDEPLTIFDVGSCEGEDAIKYARLFPRARVVAIEPLAENRDILRENIARFAPGAAITVIPVALADREGTATFHVSSGNPVDRPRAADWDYGNKSSSLLAPGRHLEIFPWIRFERTIEVKTERLDLLCGRLGIERVDFIHLDVQGAELTVLTGAGAILEGVRAVWMEVEAIPLYQDQPLKADVEAFMTSHGFVLRKDTVGAVSGDQLYVAKD